MEILGCRGRKVKISRGSITVKTDDGKTCGIVRNIVSLYNIQPNKQCSFYGELKHKGLDSMKIGLDNIIIKDDTLYFFRNIKSKLFHEKNGYFSDDEKRSMEEQEALYKQVTEAGYDVIECIFV